MTTRLIEINKKNQGNDLSLKRHQDILKTSSRNSDTVIDATAALIRYMEGHTSKTEVVNQLTSIGTPDVFEVVEAVEALHATLKTHKNTDLSELTKLMQSVLDEAKKLPKTLPEAPQIPKPVDNTAQLKDLLTAVKAVESVVKAQKLVVHPPVVNVPKSSINVEAPDLKPLQQGFKDVVKAVTKIVIPEHKTDNKAVEKLLKDANKLLKDILQKPVSSGGGGGSSWTAVNPAGIPMPLNLSASGGLITSPSAPTDIFPATQNITAQDIATSTVAGYQGQSFIIGTPTANSSTTFALSGMTTVNIQTTGIWTGSLRIEASTDGGTIYVSKFSRLPGTVYAGAATVTSNAFLIAAVSGCTHIRIRSIAAWTGTAIIKITESVNDHLVDVLNPIRLLDGTTNTIMTIKAASTPPVATDTAVVTSLNPNAPNAVATTSAVVNVGQKAVSTTAVQVSASSTLPTNGILIEALSTNSASIFIGGSGVTTSTGFELSPGQVCPFTCNLNTLYIISVASTTDRVSWNVA